MKNFFAAFLFVLSVGSAHAQSMSVGAGSGRLVSFDEDFMDEPVHFIVLLDTVAERMFEKMSNPLRDSVVDNICADESGRTLEVKVQRKIGASFACEKWPKSCFGQVYYKCTANIDLETGAILNN